MVGPFFLYMHERLPAASRQSRGGKPLWWCDATFRVTSRTRLIRCYSKAVPGGVCMEVCRCSLCCILALGGGTAPAMPPVAAARSTAVGRPVLDATRSGGGGARRVLDGGCASLRRSRCGGSAWLRSRQAATLHGGGARLHIAGVPLSMARGAGVGNAVGGLSGRRRGCRRRR